MLKNTIKMRDIFKNARYYCSEVYPYTVAKRLLMVKSETVDYFKSA